MPLERETRKIIDENLFQAGWIVQDRDAIQLSAGRGIAVREFLLSTGEADYLLVVDGEAVGVIEAKRTGSTLTGIKEQSARYQFGQARMVSGIRFERFPLPLSYETTDVEILFSNDLEPDARSRRVFHYHRPGIMAEWLKRAPIQTPNEQNDLLRSRLRHMPALPLVDLRTCQYEAITALESSFAENRPRALVQMATGSGKTYMAVSSIYRLIKYGKAKRVLFLVDRTNLAIQTRNQFRQFVTPDDGHKFTDLYNVQLLDDNVFDAASEVCITTIQRLYSILTGKPLEPEKEEESLFARVNDEGEDRVVESIEAAEADTTEAAKEQAKVARKITYNPSVPIEFFDIIFIDECHRSIYSEWRPVLEYFDAFLVGLSATPENRAFAFFQRNLVYEYSQAQSVTDGVNVDYEIYRLRTRITEQGSKVARDELIYFRNKQTRDLTYEQLEDDLIYTGRHLDHDVVASDQIRTIIQTYKDVLYTELFPERTGDVVPKTLIFAKNDTHADDIVQVVWDVFGKGNDFAKKITYRSGGKPEELINQFRINYNPRVAVSVDMISTGTDIKPLEVLLFMRPIQSRTFYEQMKGRGCRIIDDDEFCLITPNGGSKKRYILFDAIGITEGLKSDNPPLERKSSVSLEDLMKLVAHGNYSDDNMMSLAGRLGRLVKHITPDDFSALQMLTGGTLQDLGDGLLKAINYDEQLTRAQQISGQPDPLATMLEEATLQLAQEATQAFKQEELRILILQLQRREKQAIDDLSHDTTLARGFNEDQAREEVANFRAWMETHKAEIDKFDLIYQSPIGTSSEQGIASVARNIEIPMMDLKATEIDNVWRAYQKLEYSRVRATPKHQLTDLISLIRYTMLRDIDTGAILEPFQTIINRRFDDWYLEQERLHGRPFTPLQIWWLERIRDRIVTDLQCQEDDFARAPFDGKGGLKGAFRDFGSEQALKDVLKQLNERLIA